MEKTLIYTVKYKNACDDETIYYFINLTNAKKFAYEKSHLEFLRNQLRTNGDYNNDINDEIYLQEYIDNQEHITIVSKKIYQSKDEGFGELYSSFDITNCDVSNYNKCINDLRIEKPRKPIICFGMPEKYSILNNCVNGCCQTIKWMYSYEYKFNNFLSYDNFDGSYIDMENDIYVILGQKYISYLNDMEIVFWDFENK
jgi:hypothetical protein